MPPRPSLPDDDLYARLGLPVDASVEAIEVAWRALLRRHHPDVAGPDALELAKRINVAHDWLGDPAMRARYDRERGLRHARGPRGDGHGAWHARDEGRGPARSARPAPRPASRPRSRPDDPAVVLERFLDRVATLTSTDIDRLALAEPQPIAFGATIRRFLAPERAAALDRVLASIDERLPPGADRPVIRDAIDGYATELVLGPDLDELLTEPFRSRARERLTRGWDAAVGQPRYGPNGAAVAALLERVAALDAAGIRRLAATATTGVGTDDPWPAGLSVEDDEALRVSARLAAADARAAVPSARGIPTGSVIRSEAGRAAARAAQVLVLRHAFDATSYAALTATWRPWLIPEPARGPRVRSS